MTTRRCFRCGHVIDQDHNGRWLDRAANGWCPDKLVAHTPAVAVPAPRQPVKEAVRT